MTIRLHAVRHGLASNTLPRPRMADAPIWGGAAAAAVGTFVLLGWALDADALKTTFPGVLTMKANAAAGFTMMGAGVILLSRNAVASRGRWLGLALVGAAVSIALATGAQSITGVDLGIDQLLFREPAGQVDTVVPGRMSPLTAMCFTLLGLAALTGARAPRIVVALSGVALAVSVLNVFDYVFDAAVPSFLAGYTQMALNTAVTMGILALGVIGLLGPASPFAALTVRSPTASLLRRLLAVSIGVPVVLAWLRLEGQRLGLYDTSYGMSLMLVGTLTLSFIAIIRSARWANELETKREASEVERDRFFELSLDMLAVVGADGRFSRVNGAWATVLGYPVGELVGRPFLDLVHPDDLERTIAESARHYDDGEHSAGFANRYRHHDGSYRWLEWMSRTAPDRSVAFAVARDVTERKREEGRRARQRRILESRNEALTERSVRDSLTGLHNRRYFDVAVARLERRWSRLPADQRPPVSVILFDLDHFGEVNKQHGHQAGDAVLRRFSALLKKGFRESDLVARYGGEEFVAILEGTTSVDMIRIAEDIRATLQRTAVDIGTATPIRVTVSAGCAQLDDDRNASAGLSVADLWLSQAKRAGRNQVVGL